MYCPHLFLFFFEILLLSTNRRTTPPSVAYLKPCWAHIRLGMRRWPCLQGCRSPKLDFLNIHAKECGVYANLRFKRMGFEPYGVWGLLGWEVTIAVSGMRNYI